MKKHQLPFEIPISILSQINECSAGGFILFTINEFGKPEVRYHFDNPISALALQTYVSLWADACKIINMQGAVNSLSQSVKTSGQFNEEVG